VPPRGQTDQSFYHNELPAANKGTLRIQLDHLPAGNYQCSVYATGYQRNDAYTAYLRLGSPSQITREQVRLLNRAASGAPLDETVVKHRGGTFVREFAMRENDVYLVVLNKL
jgi:xylan 1,4-beta-xylosidase